MNASKTTRTTPSAKIDWDYVNKVSLAICSAPLLEMAKIVNAEYQKAGDDEIEQLKAAAHLSFALHQVAADVVAQAYALQPTEILGIYASQFTSKLCSDALSRVMQGRAFAPHADA